MAPALTLYGRPGCPWALRVRFALEARGVPYRWVTPEDPAWDPALTITPVLEHPGGRVADSPVIVGWLDAHTEGPPLARAVNPGLARFRDAFSSARGVDEGPRILLALAEALPDTGWLDGETPGLHDADAFAVLATATRVGVPLPDALSAYWARLRERPEARAALPAG